ncbi:MAG: DUF4349 domain-containing protein [Pseudonocardiales bacterium]
MRRSVIASGTVVGMLALVGCGMNKSNSATDTAARAPQVSGLAPGRVVAPGAAKNQQSAAGTRARVALGQARVVTVDLTLRAKSGADVGAIATRATDLVTAAGGSLTGDQRAEAGSGTQADLILKVPPEKYPAILGQLARLGKELSRSAQVEDVTDQVVDVVSRVSSQEASVGRIRKLLAGARNLGDVVQIEGELAKREADLESLKARQRALDGQTSFATITLHVRGPAAAVIAPAKPTRGFTAGLTAGWRAFTAATTWLLTALGALLPFLIFAAVLLAAVTAVRRRRRPNHPLPSPDPAAS